MPPDQRFPQVVVSTLRAVPPDGLGDRGGERRTRVPGITVEEDEVDVPPTLAAELPHKGLPCGIRPGSERDLRYGKPLTLPAARLGWRGRPALRRSVGQDTTAKEEQ